MLCSLIAGFCELRMLPSLYARLVVSVFVPVPSRTVSHPIHERPPPFPSPSPRHPPGPGPPPSISLSIYTSYFPSTHLPPPPFPFPSPSQPQHLIRQNHPQHRQKPIPQLPHLAHDGFHRLARGAPQMVRLADAAFALGDDGVEAVVGGGFV